MTVSVEHVNEAMTGTGLIVMLLCILLRIGYEEIAINILNAKRRIARRNLWVLEPRYGSWLVRI